MPEPAHAKAGVDRITFEILRHRLWAINDEQSLIMATISGSPIVYDALDVLSVLAIGGVITGFVAAGYSRLQRWGLLLLSALPVLALLSVVYFSVVFATQDQGRYLFVAMPAFAILLPLGLSALLSRDGERDHPVMLALPALLLAINISIFTITLPRYY